MAFKHVTAVIESWLPAAEKLVALAIAESASRDDDQCWLSLERIAQRASCTVRGAQKVILRLESMGITQRVGKKPVARGYVWIFQICIDRLPSDQPPELTGEPGSPVEKIDAETRATAGPDSGKMPTGERRSPLTSERDSGLHPAVRGERDDQWPERGSGVRVNGGASRGERGSDNPVRMNQVSEPVRDRSAPGWGPGRTSPNPNPNPELTGELRAALSAARNLGIDGLREGETLAQLDARIGEAQLARIERQRAERQAARADVPRGTDHAEPAPLSHSAVEQAVA